jgi:hypothetical protein
VVVAVREKGQLPILIKWSLCKTIVHSILESFLSSQPLLNMVLRLKMLGR